MKGFEGKIKPYTLPPPKVELDLAKKLGMKDADEEVEKFIQVREAGRFGMLRFYLNTEGQDDGNVSSLRPTRKNCPRTSGSVRCRGRSSAVPISFASTSSTSTPRRLKRCVGM